MFRKCPAGSPFKLADLNFLDGRSAAEFPLQGFQDVAGRSLLIPSAGSRFARGECNDDALLNIADPICMLHRLFLGGVQAPCVAALNVNGDARADISDASYLLSFLFLGGGRPEAPFPGCGPGTQAADALLGCEDTPGRCR